MVSRYEKKVGFINVPEDSICLYKNAFGKVSVLSPGKHPVLGKVAEYNMESNVYHYNDILVKNAQNEKLLFDVTIKDKIAGGKKHLDYDGVLYRKSKLKGQELTNAEASDWWDENHPVKKYVENEEKFIADYENEAAGMFTKSGLRRSIAEEGLQSFEDTSFDDFQNDKYNNDVVEEAYASIRKSLLDKGVQLEDLSIDRVKVYKEQQRQTKDLNISIDDKDYIEVIESKMSQAGNIDFIKKGSNTIISVDKNNKKLDDFDDSIDDFIVDYEPLEQEEAVEEEKTQEDDSKDKFVIEYDEKLDVAEKESETIIEENKKYFYEVSGLEPKQSVEENNSSDEYSSIDQEGISSEEAINMNREYLESHINNLHTDNSVAEETIDEVPAVKVVDSEEEILVIPEETEEEVEEETSLVSTNKQISSLEETGKQNTNRKKGFALIREKFNKSKVREGINTSLLASHELDDELSLTKKALADREAEIEILKAQLVEASSNNAKLQNEVNIKQDAIGKLNIDLEDKDRKINQLELIKEKISKDNKTLFDDKDTLNSNIQFLNEELESLRSQLKEKEQNYEELEKLYNDKCVELAAAGNPNEALLKVKDELLVENKKLQEENEVLKSANTVLTEDKERLTDLNVNLNNTNKQITEDNATLTQTKKDLISENTTLTQANRDLKKKNEDLTSKNKTLDEEKEKLNETNAKLIASNESLNGKINTIEDEKSELAKLNTTLEKSNKGLLDENEELKRISGISNLKIADVDVERIVLVKANGELKKYKINIKGRLNYNGKFTEDLIVDKMVYDEVKGRMDKSSIKDFEILNYDYLGNKMSLSRESNELVPNKINHK